MHFSNPIRASILLLSISLLLLAQPGAPKDTTSSKGLPPRATPTDYQVQAKAGDVTIAAEFTGHSLPTLEGPLNTTDYVGVEVALFGPTGAPVKMSAGDFSLRINGKKTLESQPYALIIASLRDPEWIAPDAGEKKSKTSMGSGGQGESNEPPKVVKVPVAEQRAWAQRVQKAALPEGDRTLPQAGLVFFLYRGKDKSIESVELVYEGPVGKATLTLQ